ncbi:MAG: hypothetical protein HN742_29660 [Lentisphaerae bacterium]|nr:hypothetical protein [Lentisphaerota bacterium]MBT4820621.1 hypothetical protein [Lentisphaerota bacterium]MBT5612830.1 hypothetical protein [Lentisphaerota bacterium]MBT7059844.1 hypothetical protein [Lentisphaerota bacterium]MBT7846076.1 hypothetical protein [Lentisphaerota bacterium]
MQHGSRSLTLEEKYRDALASIPAPGVGQGCHPFILTVANYGVMAGHSNSAVFSDIRRCIPGGRRHVPDNDIRDTIAHARRDHLMWEQNPAKRPGYQKSISKPAIDGPSYRRKLIERSEGAEDVDLWELSPVRLDWEAGFRDAIALLSELYGPDEVLFIGERYDRDVATTVEWIRELEERKQAPWPHIMPNPVDGRAHETSTGTMSRRGDAAVSELRFLLVEFDDLPLAEQCAFWHTIIRDQIMPVAALIHSGSKSLHAWIRADIPNRDTWDSVVKQELYGPCGRLTLLGADRACCNPARLSRLPGVLREDKGNWQRLVYLDPQAGLAQPEKTLPTYRAPSQRPTLVPENAHVEAA